MKDDDPGTIIMRNNDSAVRQLLGVTEGKRWYSSAYADYLEALERCETEHERTRVQLQWSRVLKGCRGV